MMDLLAASLMLSPASAYAARPDVPDRAPRLHFSGLVGARDGAWAGPGWNAGVEIVCGRGVGVLVDIDVLAHRALVDVRDDGVWDRSLAITATDFTTYWEPRQVVRLGALGGLGLHSFRQQWWTIERVLIPYLGLHASAAIRDRRGWGLRIGVRGLGDLVQPHLFDSAGNRFQTSVFEARLFASVEIPGFGDLFSSPGTLPR